MDDEKTEPGRGPDGQGTTTPGPPDGGGLRGFLRRNSDIVRHWIAFFVVLGLMLAIDELAFKWINNTLSEHTATVMAFLLSVLGNETVARETFIYSPMCSFEIVGECTGYYLVGIFLAAVAGSPASVVKKLGGVAYGIPTILAINQIRLVSLCYLWAWFPDHFHMLHMVVWQSIMVVITILVWLFWATVLARSRGPASQ